MFSYMMLNAIRLFSTIVLLFLIVTNAIADNEVTSTDHHTEQHLGEELSITHGLKDFSIHWNALLQNEESNVGSFFEVEALMWTELNEEDVIGVLNDALSNFEHSVYPNDSDIQKQMADWFAYFHARAMHVGSALREETTEDLLKTWLALKTLEKNYACSWPTCPPPPPPPPPDN